MIYEQDGCSPDFAPNSRHTIFVARFSCDKRTQRTLFPRIFPRSACLWTLYLHACYLRSLANEMTSTTNQRHVNWLAIYKYLHPSSLVSPGFTHGNARNARCFALRYLSTLQLLLSFKSRWSRKTNSNYKLIMQDGELSNVLCKCKLLAYPLHLRSVDFCVLKKERVGNGKLNFQWLFRLQISRSVLLTLFSINISEVMKPWSFLPFGSIVSNP